MTRFDWANKIWVGVFALCTQLTLAAADPTNGTLASQTQLPSTGELGHPQQKAALASNFRGEWAEKDDGLFHPTSGVFCPNAIGLLFDGTGPARSEGAGDNVVAILAGATSGTAPEGVVYLCEYTNHSSGISAKLSFWRLSDGGLAELFQKMRNDIETQYGADIQPTGVSMVEIRPDDKAISTIAGPTQSAAYLIKQENGSVSKLAFWLNQTGEWQVALHSLFLFLDENGNKASQILELSLAEFHAGRLVDFDRQLNAAPEDIRH